MCEVLWFLLVAFLFALAVDVTMTLTATQKDTLMLCVPLNGKWSSSTSSFRLGKGGCLYFRFPLCNSSGNLVGHGFKKSRSKPGMLQDLHNAVWPGYKDIWQDHSMASTLHCTKRGRDTCKDKSEPSAVWHWELLSAIPSNSSTGVAQRRCRLPGKWKQPIMFSSITAFPPVLLSISFPVLKAFVQAGAVETWNVENSEVWAEHFTRLFAPSEMFTNAFHNAFTLQFSWPLGGWVIHSTWANASVQGILVILRKCVFKILLLWYPKNIRFLIGPAGFRNIGCLKIEGKNAATEKTNSGGEGILSFLHLRDLHIFRWCEFIKVIVWNCEKLAPQAKNCQDI